MGSTFLAVLEGYAEKLREQNSRFMLAEMGNRVMDELEKTGHVDIFGRDNLFRATERPFESAVEAQHQAKKWIKEQQEQAAARLPDNSTDENGSGATANDSDTGET